MLFWSNPNNTGNQPVSETYRVMASSDRLTSPLQSNSQILKYWYSAELFQQRESQETLRFCVSLLQLYNAGDFSFRLPEVCVCCWLCVDNLWKNRSGYRCLYMGNTGRRPSTFTTAATINHSSSMTCLISSWRLLYNSLQVPMKLHHRAPLHLTLFERKTVIWTGRLQDVASAQQLSMLHVRASHLV